MQVARAPTAPCLSLTILVPVQTVEEQQQALLSLLQVAGEFLQIQSTIWVSVTLRGEALAERKRTGGLQEAAPRDICRGPHKLMLWEPRAQRVAAGAVTSLSISSLLGQRPQATVWL